MSATSQYNSRLLIEQGKKDNALDQYRAAASSVLDVLKTSDDLNWFLCNPKVTEVEKEKVINQVFKDQLPEGFVDAFLRILTDTADMQHPEMGRQTLTAFLHESDVFSKITRGVVYSAEELTKEQVDKVSQAMSERMGKKIELDGKVDAKMLGGIKVIVDNQAFDGSYRYRLDQLKQSLLQIGEQVPLQSDEITKLIQKKLSDYKKPLEAGDISSLIKSQMAGYEKQTNLNDELANTTGYVASVSDSIINVKGLRDAMIGEILRVGSAEAMVMNLEEETVGAVLLIEDNSIMEGSPVTATRRIMEVPVGDALLGRVIDSLGHPLDAKGKIDTPKRRPIERLAPGVITRSPVNQPLETGLKIIDSMIPIGRGQRELIIGDRQTGKTAIAIDTIINQKGKDVYCIYVGIGQKNATVARLVEKLRQFGAMDYTTVVVSSASDLPALQYTAPYAGCAIGEEWMESGKDVLIVYDDLSKHAIAYRTLSLLLHRPPGREAYPGDVFYLHSRLLERSAKLDAKYGGGSLTALPIVETQAGDISAYIPTNVISITDGQIFLSTAQFNSGNRPAVDVGLSVSRVGSSAQYKAMKKVSSSLKLDLAQYHEVLDFAQFGSDLDTTTRQTITHGRRLTELLKQPQYSPLSFEAQVLIFLAVQKGLLDSVPVESLGNYQDRLVEYINTHNAIEMQKLTTTKKLDEDLENQLVAAITAFNQVYSNLVAANKIAETK